MAIESPAPVTADQVLNALAALGTITLVDPEMRPDGLTDADVPHLLGTLLAVAELEIAARVHPADDPPRELADLLQAWRDQIGEGLADEVLAHRAQRTLFDFGLTSGGEDSPEPRVRATTRVLTAAQALIGARASRGADPAGLGVLAAEAELVLTEALAELRRARDEES
ncbi:hypothetical protein BJF83_20755 [Nocardiopsis sp. CNR-923]|uniref:hypothetical protein n=1 Tax=Nocardiopsis sp. CNR-923 TaxID=1904965 RepID=UPI0009662E05|nr:hypothetical protein [Nocardiopsis sp. CNR-923]OLT26596.1 hypothetical protein BJF83_20755 [Nocardiopsis sp. CNR-923]